MPENLALKCNYWLKGLARISKTIGRTQAINIFDRALTPDRLPGYGYAKVPKAVRERWGKTIDLYLQDRESRLVSYY